MCRFVYTVWFRDLRMPPGDQDHEWPACFVVEAASAGDALSWGDHLAHSYAKRSLTEHYLRAEVDDAVATDSGVASLPVVPFGYEATDSDIGW